MGTILDGSAVAAGTKVVANFDRVGVQVTLAGAGATGATGAFSDGDLGGAQIVVNSGTGGSFQIGSQPTAANRLEISLPDLRATGTQLNLGSTSVATQGTAQSAITSVDSAVSTVAQQRGNLGAAQNLLRFASQAIQVTIENVQKSESTISDADIASEVHATDTLPAAHQPGNIDSGTGESAGEQRVESAAEQRQKLAPLRSQPLRTACRALHSPARWRSFSSAAMTSRFLLPTHRKP